MPPKESFVNSMVRKSKEKSRAQDLRTRRQHSQSKTKNQPSVANTARKKSAMSVPVTRRRSYTAPVIDRKRNKVGVPLKTKGAELQLPAFPKLRLGWRLISGAIFIFSFVIVICFTSLSAFEVSAINLKGAQRLIADEITSQVSLIGMPIIEIEPEKLESQLLERFPGLTEVAISTGLPASVTIKVSERKPVILWQQDNSPLWIDEEGIIFPVRGEEEVILSVVAASDPPAAQEPDEAPLDQESEVAALISEQPTYTRTTPEFVQGVLAISSYVPEGSYLQYDPQFGLGWQDVNGWLVYFGKDITNIDMKLTEYQTIIAELRNDSITPALISLEFLHAPFYRLE